MLLGGWIKDVLKSIADIIRTLPPYWRAVSLMVFILPVMFLVLIEKLPDQAWMGLGAALLIGMTGILYKPQANDPSLAEGQDRRTDMILPKGKSAKPKTKQILDTYQGIVLKMNS